MILEWMVSSAFGGITDCSAESSDVAPVLYNARDRWCY